MGVHIKHELVVFWWALYCTLNTLLSGKYCQNLQYTPRDRKARSRAKKFMCLRSVHSKCLCYLRACGYYYDKIAPLYSWWVRKPCAPWPSEFRLSFTSALLLILQKLISEEMATVRNTVHTAKGVHRFLVYIGRFCNCKGIKISSISNWLPWIHIVW